jgi:hypothetical protein
MNNPDHIREVPERVFFVKCRPQGADIIDLVLSEKRVFIGYPPWRRGVPYNPQNIASCVIDLRNAGEGWKSKVRDYHQSMKTNQGFASSVEKGWIVAIPRPGKGICWIAEIAGPFELVEKPRWKERYLQHRLELGLNCENEASHVGDVVQSWHFSRAVPVPFGQIPRWISYRLLSRSTIGEIYGVPELGLRAHAVLKRFIDGVSQPPLSETNDVEEIARRLVTFVSPSALEHLAVALLQLEHPRETWWHIGGSGDGGSDGLGYTDEWVQTGQVQCKWLFNGTHCSDVFESTHDQTRRVLVSLIHGSVERDIQNAEFWGREEIARLMKKHARSVPMARSIRVVP